MISITKLITIIFLLTGAYGCIHNTVIDNNIMNTYSHTAHNEQKDFSVNLILEDNLTKKENLSVGSSMVGHYSIIPLYESKQLKFDLKGLTETIVVKSFMSKFNKISTDKKASPEQFDYVCSVELNDDYTNSYRDGGTMIIVSAVNTKKEVNLFYNIDCKSTTLNEVRLSANFYLNDKSNNINAFGWSLQAAINNLNSEIDSKFPFSKQEFAAKKLSLQSDEITSVNQQDLKGNTLLHYAVQNKDIAGIQHLLDLGADINIGNFSGDTPVHFAAVNFDPNIFKIIEAKADLTIKNKSGQSPESIIATKICGGKIDNGIFNDIITISSKPKFSYFSDVYPVVFVNNPDPFKSIQKTVNIKLEKYLAMADNPVEVPPIVQKPLLPAPIKLTQTNFESSKTFKERVLEAENKRKNDIEKLQVKYRHDVEERNNLIKEKEKIAKMRLLSANFMKKVFLYDTINQVLGEIKLHSPKYNADTEQMYVTLESTKTQYKKNVILKVPEGQTAKAYYENIQKVPVIVTYKYDNDSMILTDIEAPYEGYNAKVDMRSTDFSNSEPIEVVIHNQQSIEEEQQLQNPNLIDNGNINIIVYEKTKDNFIDDLPRKLESVPAVKPSNNNWLFVIGVEDYNGNTDKVVYSSRSAELFRDTASKTIGINPSHIYSSIGDDATAGTIKTNLKRLISNVKEGDNIYFYYSGHGIPVPADNDPYILPKDIIPDYIADEDFFKLQNIYKMLSESKAKQIVAFVDSCFSGVTDGESVYKGVAASRLKPKNVLFDQSKMVVITAGTDKQFSNMYPEKGHRLFSYFVIDSLLDGRKDVKTLYNEVYVKVKDVSFEMGGDVKKQEPSIIGNINLAIR